MLKTRCPSCSKLYAVDRNDVAPEQAPQFECLACKTRFSMVLPRDFFEKEADGATEVKSVPIEWQSMPSILEEASSKTMVPPVVMKSEEPAKRPEFSLAHSFVEDQAAAPCVKCGFRNLKGVDECVKCGVIFSRIAVQGEHRFRVKPQINAAWEAVLNDYSNLPLHREFIQSCNIHSCLPYAAYRYQSILEADPSEDVALKMRQYVIALAQAPAVVAQNTGWQPSFTRLSKMMRPLFLVLGFLFAFVHIVTGISEFRYVGIVLLMTAFVFYLVRLWKSYDIRFEL